MNKNYFNRNIYLTATLPVFILLVLQLLGFDGLYGQDSYEYLRYTERLQEFLMGGDHPGDLVWPKGYLMLCALLGFLMPNALAGQLISLFCLYGIAYFLEKLIRHLYSNRSFVKPFIVIAFLLAPYVLRLSVVMMADTLAMLCVIATTFFAFKYKEERNTKTAILFLFWAAFAGFSRYAALVPIAPLLLWVFILWLKKPQVKHLLALVIPSFLILIHFYLEAGGSDFLGHHFIENWSFKNLFKSTFISDPALQIPNTSYTFPNIVFYIASLFHPGFFFGSIILFALNIKKIKDYIIQFPAVIFASISIYIIFLYGITFQGNRYLTLIYPLFLLFLYPAFVDGLEKLKKHREKVVIALLLIQLALFYRAMKPSFMQNILEQSLASSLEKYQGETLYSFEVDIALQQRKLDFAYKSIWQEELNTFENQALVLFNEERIRADFDGKNPILNWEKMNQEMSVIKLAELKDGWNLYRLEK